MRFDSPLGYNMKQIRFQIGIVILLAAGLLAGCAHDNEPTMLSEIAVTTGITGMQKRVQSIDSNTALQGKEIRVDAYFHGTNTAYLSNTRLHYTGTTPPWQFWNGTSQLHYYWPIAGSVYDPNGANITVTSLDFVGFCPYTPPTYITDPGYDVENGGAYFTCNMSSYMTLANQASMQEYVIAVSNSQTFTTQTDNGGVPLQFKHPLAQIKFVLNAASGTHVTVNSIGIANAYTNGTCRYDGSTISWTGIGSDTVKIAQTLKIGETTETSSVYVIPANGTKYLNVNAMWDDWGNVTISDYGTDVTFNWVAGHTYTYNLTIDKYGLKVDTLQFTEQW